MPVVGLRDEPLALLAAFGHVSEDVFGVAPCKGSTRDSPDFLG